MRHLIADEGWVDERHVLEVLWRRGDLEFLLWPQQRPLWDAMNAIPKGVTEFVLLLARQFGKSTLGVTRALSQAAKHRDSCILVMGPDVKQTKDIVLPKMRFLSKTAPKGLIKQMKADNRFHIYHDLNPKAGDYTEFIIGGMSESASSQRGKTVQEIMMEEIVDVPEDHYLESLRSDLGPALTHSKDGKIIFLTTLPKVPDHPFITETMPKAELSKAIRIFTIYDNKALTEQQFSDCVERAGGLDSDDWKREYLCQIVRDRNRVCLPDYDESDAVRDFEIPAELRAHVTADWGGVRDKTVAALHWYDYLTDTDCFWDERVFPPNTPSDTIVTSLKAMERDFWALRQGLGIESRYIDGPHQFVTVDLSSHVYNYPAAVPVKPSLEASVNRLNSRCAKRRVWIHPRCEFLRLSARSCQFNEKKTDFARSEILGHCDGIAAMMYAVNVRNTTMPGADFFPPPPSPERILQARLSDGIVKADNSQKIFKGVGRFK